MSHTGTVLFVRAAGGRGLDSIESGFDVVVADSGVDALKRLSAGTDPDCLVTPTTLPGLPLRTFTEQVRRAAPEVALVVIGEIPVEPDAATALVDADAYVPPGRVPGLPDRISRVLDERRVRRSVGRHGRLARAVADVAADAACARDRVDVESAFHDRLVEGELYRHVWVARRGEDGGVDVRLPVSGRIGPEELSTLVGGGDVDFLSRAVETGQVVTAEGLVQTRSAASARPGDPDREGPGGRALATAAIPFVRDGHVHGVGLLSTDGAGAFDGAERELLADVGAIVGHALQALEAEEGRPARPDPARGMENLVHDLRNPLGIARSHLEIAREDGEPASLERVEAALDRMVETVDRVATGVPGDPAIDPAPDDLESAAELAWQSIDSRSASLEVEGSATVRADRDLFVRLLANLFQNAVDHGGADVTVRVGASNGGFYVEDDGPGIPAHEREAVLRRGYSTSDDGLGIGLSIVDDVAEAHGWTLSVTEAESGGARFELAGVDLVGGRETR